MCVHTVVLVTREIGEVVCIDAADGEKGKGEWKSGSLWERRRRRA